MKLLSSKLFAIAAISCLGILIYSGTFHSPFQFDDEPSIVNNFSIRYLSDLKTIWNYCSTRFITYLTIATNYHFGKLNVFGYHLFNIFIHVLSAIAVWWFTLLTLVTPAIKGQRIASHRRFIALFTGLLFVSHPIQTESVTYIIQRTASLAALFSILSLCFYAKSRLSEARGMIRAYYALSLLFALLAIFSRESAVMLPISIVLYEIFFFQNSQKMRWICLILFFIPILAIPIIKPLSFVKEHITGPAGISSLDYFLTQLRVIVTYLRLLVFPIHQNLDYDYPISKSFLEMPVFLSFLFLSILLMTAVFLYKRHRILSFAVFWFFIALSVESSVIPLKDIIFEHRLYLPMAGFSLFLVSVIYEIAGKKSIKPVIPILFLVVACFSILAYYRNAVWKDRISLWDDTVRKSPNKARPYYNRGLAYELKSEPDKAILDYSKAIEIKPDFFEAYNNRGGVYQSKGYLEKAMADFNKALEIEPRCYDAYNNRGNAYRSQGDLHSAISDFNKAIKIKPDYYKAYSNRGSIYQSKRELDKAISDYNKALEINPDFCEGYNNRGFAYQLQGRFDQALSDYQKAIEINSAYSDAYSNRGSVYQLQGNFDKAIGDYNKALTIKPGLYKTYNNRGLAYQSKGDFDKAIDDFTKSIEINPKNGSAYGNRALAYFSKEDYNKAWRDILEAESLGYKIDPKFLDKLKKKRKRI